MLTRRLLVLVATVVLVLSGGSAALADPVVSCPPDSLDCSAEIGGGGQTGGGNNSGANNGGSNSGGTGKGGRVCRRGTQTVPCYHDVYGWFNSKDGCYYKLAEPQPANVPEGHSAYLPTCGGVVAPEGVILPDPPEGFEQRATPEELAYRALANITLGEPVIQMAPNPGGAGLVGLPVWMWTPQTRENWGPNPAWDAEAGLRVDITARVTRIDWDMGNGVTVTCTTPGTPYDESYGAQPSPDCGYPAGYQRSSRHQPGGKYPVTATTTWTVDYTSSAGSGTLPEPVIRESTTALRIDELQVVTR